MNYNGNWLKIYASYKGGNKWISLENHMKIVYWFYIYIFPSFFSILLFLTISSLIFFLKVFELKVAYMQGRSPYVPDEILFSFVAK